MRSSIFETIKFKVIKVMGSHNVLGCFPKVRTGQPDHGQTSHFDNEIGFFQEFLGFDCFDWIILIKSEILITMVMLWPVRPDK